MAVDFKIDGNTIDPQPSAVEYTPAEAATDRAANGGHVAHVRAKGGTVRVTYGAGAAKTAALAALRTARNSVIAHTVTWTDPSAVTTTLNVLWLSDPAYGIRMPELYDRFSFMLLERPD